MSITFTKLFTSITESTIWREDDHTRIVWITMLAMADRNGRVFASIPGLADRARVPVESAEKALQRFQSPDRYSRTPDHEGRRIEVIDGGWRLLNHAKYRELRDEEAIKESKRKYINAKRAKEREAKSLGITTVPHDVENVERSRHNADADADADADAAQKHLKGRKKEPILANGSLSSFNASKAPKIPKALASKPAFVDAWNSHYQDVLNAKSAAEAITWGNRQLGLCLKWYQEFGIEKVLEVLDGAINCGNWFLVDEDHGADLIHVSQ
jgi:hypothetical protein